jgi:hypothetical protein
MLTLDTVRANIFAGDPLAKSPDEVTDTGTAIEIAGIDDGTEFREDLRFVSEGDGVELLVRDPGTVSWNSHGVFRDWRELHIWIYEL